MYLIISCSFARWLAETTWWIFNVKLRGSWSLQQQTGCNYTTHMWHCVQQRSARVSLLLRPPTWVLRWSQSHDGSSALHKKRRRHQSQLHHLHKRVLLPRLSCLGIRPWPRRRATSLWPRQQKKRWCCFLACRLRDAYLSLDLLSVVRDDWVPHRDDCQRG